MRLIDADSLLEEIDAIEWSDNMPAAIIATILKAPTIKPAPLIEKSAKLDAEEIARIVIEKLITDGGKDE